MIRALKKQLERAASKMAAELNNENNNNNYNYNYNNNNGGRDNSSVTTEGLGF